jgi:hypothetical protein
MITWPKTRKDKISPDTPSIRSTIVIMESGIYHSPLITECTKARSTPLGYRIDCRLWEEVVVQEGKVTPSASDSHGWQRIQKGRLR